MNEKTSRRYWEGVHNSQPKPRLPSRFLVGPNNLQRLLKAYITPDSEVLEIGCAPGKMLAYVRFILEANVSGLDYSERGIAKARALFQQLGIAGNLQCENIFSTSFPANSFDFVYSVGLIEHFDNPTKIVRQHVDLVKPGGTALLVIPNYQGIYRRLQKYFDNQNLLMHNLNIMSVEALADFVPKDLVASSDIFYTGKFNPGLINTGNLWPPLLSKLFYFTFNFVGLLQPFEIKSLCSFIAMKLTKSP